MRSQFIKSLVTLRKKSEGIYLIVADLGYSVVEPFKELFEESFINVGVAEQNMAGIAAGLASEDAIVFCYSIGNFTTFRCAEQIRNDIDYHNLPVCMVSVGGGVAYGNMGYSHHAIQDFGLMRSLPNMMICSPCDALECMLLMDLIIKRKQPSYLRLHKQGEEQISKSEDPIIAGKPRFYGGNINGDVAIVTTGYAAQGVYSKYSQSINHALFTIPAWGMKFRSHINSWADKYTHIYVVEDHLFDCGFCSWILETLASKPNIMKIKSKAINESIIGYVATESAIHSKTQLYEMP